LDLCLIDKNGVIVKNKLSATGLILAFARSVNNATVWVKVLKKTVNECIKNSKFSNFKRIFN